MSQLWVAVAIAAVTLTGCGDDDDDVAAPDPTSPATSETTSGATSSPTPTGTSTETPADGQVLTGVVGENDSFTISLTDSEGNPVTSIPAGTYTIQVSDLSDIHNFHLTGPGGVDESTTVPDTVDVTWEVTFEPGTYTYVCDPHPARMQGEFEVT